MDKQIEYAEKVLFRQLNNLYDTSPHEFDCIHECMPNVFEKIYFCFSKIANKYYHNDNEIIFNPLHNCHYTMLLYWVAHILYRKSLNNTEICDKLYNMSKMISSADLFYDVDLPDIFFFDHPQGSVIGKGTFNNYFTFSQGCTIGNNYGIYPLLGHHVHMMAYSKILGNCKIGNNVILAANSMVIDTDIPDNSIVFGCHPNLTIKYIDNVRFKKITESYFY